MDIKTVDDYFRGIQKIEFQGLYYASKLQEVAGLRMSESGGIKLLNKSIEDIKNGILKIDGKKDLAKNDRDRIIILDKDDIVFCKSFFTKIANKIPHFCNGFSSILQLKKLHSFRCLQ